MDDFDKFCKNFDLTSNALSMRTMIRWNGRDIRCRENLSEHTHLVVACAIEIFDNLPNDLKSKVDFEKLIRLCLIHDSLEMLRGDILSVTKDVIPNLRNLITEEENEFYKYQLGEISELVYEICTLSDLKACYKFIEYEIRYPNNDFALNVYKSCLTKYKNFELKFNEKYGIKTKEDKNPEKRLSKGYKLDAGTDIILNEDVTFMPHTTSYNSLNLNISPKEGEMAILCARTSAAIKGLTVAMCPIDTDYSGDITAIVSNTSNNIITYKKGDSFCQVIFLPVIYNNIEEEIRKQGSRRDGKFGSTT